jgi:hypothetical protein
MAAIVLLREHPPETATRKRLRHRYLDGGPADATDALNLAAFDRVQHVARGAIARNEPPLRAEQSSGDVREVDHRAAGRGAAEHDLGREDIGKRLDRRILAQKADRRLRVGIADVAKLVGVERPCGVAVERIDQHAWEHEPDRCAILGRGRIDSARHDATAGARLIGHDDNRIAGDVLLHVAREQARVGVEAAAGSGADHDGYRLVLEQRLLSASLVRCAGEQDTGRNGAHEAKFLLAHGLPVRLAVFVALAGRLCSFCPNTFSQAIELSGLGHRAGPQLVPFGAVVEHVGRIDQRDL